MTQSNHDAASTEANLNQLLGDAAARPWWRRPGAWLLLAAVLAAAATALWLLRGRTAEAQRTPRFQTEAVQRGALDVKVVANGTLAPTLTVNIGSELSGTVAKVLVDINDAVKKGQVLVELDTTKLGDQIARSRATLASRGAGVAQAAATLKEARANLARMEEVSRLSGGRVPSATEFDSARANADRALADEAAARSAVADARAALRVDETNLSKASIRSPIDGVVLTRAVDPGNAVAASLQAVTLFTIAADLTQMKLQVNVDEADVGQVREGQSASFTVAAWPNRSFPASITRVGFGSTTKENVVTYVAELRVANGELLLRPGMTATASIAAVHREDVLLVPNAALRFTPSAASAQGTPGASQAAPADGSLVSKLMMPQLPRGPKRAGTVDTKGGQRQLWVLRDGVPVALTVQAGLSDGRQTEVSGELREGEAVIVDELAPPR
ncbi:MAG TPA: efflux RND transporter periplasmic adaptor subunit [Rubrivivax sp.]|nr:efflux RND transporter periplasmic adaptor subunit [Rubrivivax sp.]